MMAVWSEMAEKIQNTNLKITSDYLKKLTAK